MFTIGLSVIMSLTATAPVGFGFALGIPPKDAQVPMAIIPAASFADSLSISTLLMPLIVEYPGLPTGTEPSTNNKSECGCTKFSPLQSKMLIPLTLWLLYRRRLG